MRKVEAELGIVSVIGAVACAVIASELYADLTTGTAHFPLPRWVKVAAFMGFCLFTVLETNKARTRLARGFGLV